MVRQHLDTPRPKAVRQRNGELARNLRLLDPKPLNRPDRDLELDLPARHTRSDQLVPAQLLEPDHLEAAGLLQPWPLERARGDRTGAVRLQVEERVADRDRYFMTQCRCANAVAVDEDAHGAR